MTVHNAAFYLYVKYIAFALFSVFKKQFQYGR